MKIYKVGGFVRDTLMNIKPKDVDYVVVGATEQEMYDLGFTKVGASFPVFLKDGEEYALARRERKVGVGYNGFEVEFSPDVTLEEDLSRRDLTMNAMAMDDDGKVIDPFDGRTDMAQGVLRHVSDAFAEDPVRVLRTARFAARYNFTVHPDTLALMEKVAPELDFVTKERLWAEFEKGLSEPDPTIMGEVLWQCKAFNVKALKPYMGFGTRHMYHFVPTDTIMTKFVALTGSSFDGKQEEYRIPTEFSRVAQAVGKHNMTLSAWVWVPIEDRLKALGELRAFNDTTLLDQVCDVIAVYRRFDSEGVGELFDMIRKFIHYNIEVAKSVDTTAIAAATKNPKDIGPAIFAARVAALEADPECRTLSLPM